MKCRYCSQPAVIFMRQHRLILCKDHFSEWLLTQTERHIKKYGMFTHSDRVLVAVSGGKDSLSLWDILWKNGYDTEGVYIDLGISNGAYSHKSKTLCEKFSAERNLKLNIVNIPEVLDNSIAEIASKSRRGRERPCSVCGLIKRYWMNKAALDGGFDVIVTGHNLDDEAATLYANVMNWSTDLLARQKPVLESAGGFARKAKPFCRFYEREIAAYAIVTNIDYIYEECPFSEGAKSIYYKALLNKMEDDFSGSKLAFYVKFLNAVDKDIIFSMKEVAVGDDSMTYCTYCGMPTQSDGLCAYCKLVASLAT